jgi:hypothetical protein
MDTMASGAESTTERIRDSLSAKARSKRRRSISWPICVPIPASRSSRPSSRWRGSLEYS